MTKQIDKLISRDGVKEYWVEFPETYETDMHKMAHVDDLPSQPDDSIHVIEAAHVVKLEAALKVAVEALDFYRDYTEFREVPRRGECARQALAEIERIAGGE